MMGKGCYFHFEIEIRDRTFKLILATRLVLTMVLHLLCRKRDAKPKRSHGIVSLPGYKSPDSKWINQDNYLIETDEENKHGLHTFCIFDGHGYNGHLVSEFCSKRLLDILTMSGGCVEPAFAQLQKELDGKFMHSYFETNSSYY